MSDALYTLVTNNVRMPDQDPGDTTSWVKAAIYLNGSQVSEGFAPERPPYVEGTARSSAISLAQIHFSSKVLTEDIRDVMGTNYKTVRGPN